jgi:hypothetical protein
MLRFRRPISTMRAVCLLALFVLVGIPIFCMLFLGFRINREFVRLMHQTDHQRLLKACRELSANVNPGYGEYGIRQQKILHPTVDSERRQLPREILDLNPECVVIYGDGIVSILFLGDFRVYAYPKDYEPGLEDYEYGDEKIIDGLWLYHD